VLSARILKKSPSPFPVPKLFCLKEFEEYLMKFTCQSGNSLVGTR